MRRRIGAVHHCARDTRRIQARYSAGTPHEGRYQCATHAGIVAARALRPPPILAPALFLGRPPCLGSSCRHCARSCCWRLPASLDLNVASLMPSICTLQVFDRVFASWRARHRGSGGSGAVRGLTRCGPGESLAWAHHELRASRQRAAACPRVSTPSLSRMLATWRLTVCGLRSKARAINLLLSPAAMCWSTSRSRSLS